MGPDPITCACKYRPREFLGREQLIFVVRTYFCQPTGAKARGTLREGVGLLTYYVCEREGCEAEGSEERAVTEDGVVDMLDGVKQG